MNKPYTQSASNTSSTTMYVFESVEVKNNRVYACNLLYERTVASLARGNIYSTSSSGSNPRYCQSKNISGTTTVITYLTYEFYAERGSYIDYVISTSVSYPSDGASGSYWYIRR